CRAERWGSAPWSFLPFVGVDVNALRGEQGTQPLILVLYREFGQSPHHVAIKALELHALLDVDLALINLALQPRIAMRKEHIHHHQREHEERDCGQRPELRALQHRTVTSRRRNRRTA